MNIMRFALYYAPSPSSLLWKLGCKWLGGDALSRKKIKQDRFSRIEPHRVHELTRIPRRYGLHATLKPPFRIARNRSEAELRSAIAGFTACCHPFSTSPLVLRQINDFFCLCPEKQTTELGALAAACVQNFDTFRAPLTRLELARQRAEILTSSEKQNLTRWGYPYVMDAYRFHITLTCRIINGSEKRILHSLLSDIFAPILGKPLVIDAIGLFTEPTPGQPFFYSERFPFNNLNQTDRDISTPDELGIFNNILNRSEQNLNM